MNSATQPLTPRQWLLAMRPWSFTASAVPVLFGAGLAALGGHWNIWLFALTLAGSVALQAGTNLHNTYGDFISGVDSVDSAHTCPQLVTGQTTPSIMYRAGWLAFGLAGVVAFVLAVVCGPVVLVFAALGVAGGYAYTNGKMPYKYAGLGPYFVFLLMGPLMALPAYYIQTGSLSLAPVFGSLSISCLVAAIMHANDIRDIPHDSAAHIRTVAMRLGRERAVQVFVGLNLGAFALLAVMVVAGVLPGTCLLVFLLLPGLLAEIKKMRSPAYDVTPLEGWAAKFHLQFGLLLTFALLAALGLQYFWSK